MSLFATAEARARQARTTLELLIDSLALARDSWKELCGIVALGAAPGAVLVYAASLAAGFGDAETTRGVMAGEQVFRLVPVAAATGLSRLLGLFATLALILAGDARERGAPIGALEAWRRAFAMARAFLSAFARVMLSGLAWSLLFILPGVVVLLRGAFFAHAAAIEGLDGRAAAARSRALVSRRPAYLLGNLLASGVIAGAAAFAAVLCLRLLMAAPTALVPMNGGLLETQLISLLDRLAAGVIGGWATGFSVLLYKDAAASAGA